LDGLSAQDTQIFEDQDLIVTQHSQISSYILKDQDGNDVTTNQFIPRIDLQIGSNQDANPQVAHGLCQLHRAYNLIGMIHSKKVLDCTQYQQILYKFFKLVELELKSQSNAKAIIVIPLDFFTLLIIHNKSNNSKA